MRTEKNDFAGFSSRVKRIDMGNGALYRLVFIEVNGGMDQYQICSISTFPEQNRAPSISSSRTFISRPPWNPPGEPSTCNAR